MTSSTTSSSEAEPAPDGQGPEPPTGHIQDPLNVAVAKRASLLQKRSNADAPDAVRRLALLRRSVGTAPGSNADIWADTIDLVSPGPDEREDDPTPAELAAHHAMTLFAMHRQGRCRQAHRPNVAPGAAFALVASKRGAGEAASGGVRRRFDALITAPRPAEGAHHLRGLILLARSEDVGLDYGLLAADLCDLWSSSEKNRHRVRLRWARQYRGFTTTTRPGADEGATTTDIDDHEERA